ncbi:hypothetical protein FGO68_gene13708 [Halteria grandinella]|uniref:Uncharacterized protein n=1 Tax=Halteria grandinella TaxID=5974 RepID=A0A8J8NJD3_HALGN|nr:hypothetical protein FGO68_gene13708 [Halteria grandinella]
MTKINTKCVNSRKTKNTYRHLSLGVKSRLPQTHSKIISAEFASNVFSYLRPGDEGRLDSDIFIQNIFLILNYIKQCENFSLKQLFFLFSMLANLQEQNKRRQLHKIQL